MSEHDMLLVLAAAYDNLTDAELDHASKEVDANAEELARQLREAQAGS
jgi:hypothetical protein